MHTTQDKLQCIKIMVKEYDQSATCLGNQRESHNPHSNYGTQNNLYKQNIHNINCNSKWHYTKHDMHVCLNFMKVHTNTTHQIFLGHFWFVKACMTEVQHNFNKFLAY